MIKRMTLSISMACLVSMVVVAKDEKETEPQKGATSGVCVLPGPQKGGGDVRRKKRIWAGNHLWADAPKIEFAKWLTKKPDLKGKFVLIEFWRTWCGACKRETPRMNALHATFGKDLVIIAVTAETEDVVKAHKGPKKNYHLVLDKPHPLVLDEKKVDDDTDEEDVPDDLNPTDTRKNEQGAYEAHFGVWGWPHSVLLEPTHHTVVWEGFVGLKGCELTADKVARYIAISKQMTADLEKDKKPEGK